MRLLGVELRRFASRRAVAVLLLVAAALAVLLVVSAAYGTRPPSATERAVAEQQLGEQVVAAQAELDACLADPEAYLGGGATARDCEATQPRVEWFLERQPLDLADEVEGRGTVLLVLLAGIGIVAGATFAGADWASGSLANQLLFEPRRTRVWLAKAVAVVLGTTLAAAAVVAGFWLALHLVAAGRDVATTARTWEVVLGVSGRGVALVAAVTLGGYALTMLMRSTVGTLGLLFGYAVVGEGLTASLPFDRMSRWSLPENVQAWLHDGSDVFDESICGPTDRGCSPWYELGLGHASAYLGGLLLLAVVASLVAFRRRDVP
jgi:ABC-2 type transport system permease protein